MNEYNLNINLISNIREDGEKILNFFRRKIEKTEIEKIFDYWNWEFNLNQSFDTQVDIIIKKFIAFKDDDEYESIPKECLIVISNESQAELILKKINDEINEKDFMPLTLFLYKEKKFNINIEKKYPNIDPRIIFIENLDNLDYFPDGNEFNPIQMILMRFCSIYNELGERFHIGEKNNIRTYELTKNSFSFYLNIFCLGKIRQGKSTTVNCILNELKARESLGGTSQTNKITYYEVEKYPIKIYDLPGFQDKESINKAVEKMKELNVEIESLKQKFHIILYILNNKSIDKFQDNEFLIFRELLNHKEAKIIYILTHSGEKDKKNGNVIIRKMNKSIKNIIKKGIKEIKEKEKLNEDELQNLENKIIEKTKIAQENTVFVNFYKEDEEPKLGINDLFKTINKFFQETQSYIHRNDDLVKKGETLKIAAKNNLNNNLIGGSIVGCIPLVDIIAQEAYIKPNAIKKASEIFGLNYNDIIKEEENDLIEKASENTLVGIAEGTGYQFINTGFQKVAQTISTTVTQNVDKYFCGIKYGTQAVETTVDTTKYVAKSIFKGAFGVGTVGISAIIGGALGYYFTSKNIDSIVNKLYEYYIKISPSIGRFYEEAANYLEQMQKKYTDKTQTSK